jgi:hypothetical protein
MRKDLKFRCHAVPAGTIGLYTVGKVYDGYEGWWDAETGETCIRIYTNFGKYHSFRDNNWNKYFEEILN